MSYFSALVVFLLLHGTAPAQRLMRVMSGHAAISEPVPFFGRTDAGSFENNGLRTEVASVRSALTMVQALVSGEIQMARIGRPAMLAAGMAGMDIGFVGGRRPARTV